MSGSSEVSATKPDGWTSRRIVIVVISGVLVGLPLLRMLGIVHGGSKSQYADYWMMVPSVFRSDGWLSLSGLFELRNEHPIAGAKVLYWVNYKLSGGSNITLGYIVIALAIAQVVLIALLIRRNRKLPDWAAASVVVVFASILFGRLGTWNFAKAMSGSAWLGASLLVIAAIHSEKSRRHTPTLVLGVLASFTYGTGLMVWPALLATGLVRDRRIRSQWRTIVVGALVFGIYAKMRLDASGTSAAPVTALGILKHACVTIGSALGGSHQAVDIAIAISTVAIGIVAGGILIRKRDPEAAPWVGLFVWGVLCSLIIASGRNALVVDFATSRYVSIGLVTITAAFALAVHATDQVRPMLVRGTAVISVAIVVVAWFAGSGAYRDSTSLTRDADLLAVALRVDAAHGGVRWTMLEDMPHIEPLLEEIGHYPFDGRMTFGCDRIGTQLSSKEVEEKRPDEGRSTQATTGNEQVPNGRLFVGRTFKKPDCIVVTDGNRKVIGAGVWQSTPQVGQPDFVGFDAVAPLGEDSYRIYIRYPDAATFYRVRNAFGRSAEN